MHAAKQMMAIRSTTPIMIAANVISSPLLENRQPYDERSADHLAHCFGSKDVTHRSIS
jgi:hypothetical protein